MFLNLGCGDDFRGDIRIDINPNKKGVNLVADAHCIPLRDKIVDGILCKSVLEHLLNPFKGLLEMQRVSKNNILVIVPNVHHWRRIARGLLSPGHEINPLTKHLQAWDGQAFKLLVNQIDDLEVVCIEWGYFNGVVSWPSMFFGSQMIVELRVENESLA